MVLGKLVVRHPDRDLAAHRVVPDVDVDPERVREPLLPDVVLGAEKGLLRDRTAEDFGVQREHRDVPVAIPAAGRCPGGLPT